MNSLISLDPWLTAAWLVNTTLLVAMTGCLRGWRWRRLRSLHKDTRGTSYVTSLLLCFPIYVVLIAAIVESSLLLMVSIGTKYASHAAGRSARVWLPAECSEETIHDKIEMAAMQAMTPFASSDERHVIPSTLAQRTGDAAYREAFEAYGGRGLVTDKYLLTKRLYARGATRVTWASDSSNDEVEVTVQYDVPIRIPGIGPLFGTHRPTPGRPYWTRTLTSKVVVTLETPRSENHSLGIRYGTPH